MKLPSKSDVLDFIASDQNNWKILGNGVSKVVFSFDDDFVIAFLKNNDREHYWTDLLLSNNLLFGQKFSIPTVESYCLDHPIFKSRSVYILEKLYVPEYFTEQIQTFIQNNFLYAVLYKCLGTGYDPYSARMTRKVTDNHDLFIDCFATPFPRFVNLWKQFFPEYHKLIVREGLERRFDPGWRNFGFRKDGTPVLFDIIHI